MNFGPVCVAVSTVDVDVANDLSSARSNSSLALTTFYIFAAHRLLVCVKLPTSDKKQFVVFYSFSSYRGSCLKHHGFTQG